MEKITHKVMSEWEHVLDREYVNWCWCDPTILEVMGEDGSLHVTVIHKRNYDLAVALRSERNKVDEKRFWLIPGLLFVIFVVSIILTVVWGI